MKREHIINRFSEILNEGIKFKNEKLNEIAVKYYLNSPQKGYNVYYCVKEKEDPVLSRRFGISNYDMGEPLKIEKKLLLNSSPFKHKSAANQFAKYKAKEYSVKIYNNLENTWDTNDFIEIVDEN